jgi:hypothetical protein
LATALTTNSTLRWLHLDNNQIGREGIRQMIVALNNNGTLQDVNFHKNLMFVWTPPSLSRNRDNAAKREATLFNLLLKAHPLRIEN